MLSCRNWHVAQVHCSFGSFPSTGIFGGQQVRALKSCLELSTQGPFPPGPRPHSTVPCVPAGTGENQNQGSDHDLPHQPQWVPSDPPADRQPPSSPAAQSWDTALVSVPRVPLLPPPKSQLITSLRGRRSALRSQEGVPPPGDGLTQQGHSHCAAVLCAAALTRQMVTSPPLVAPPAAHEPPGVWLLEGQCRHTLCPCVA